MIGSSRILTAVTLTTLESIVECKSPLYMKIQPSLFTLYNTCFRRPVYEMVLDKEIIMRRRNDGWINATHILKVANFDKPQRTRILEREVQVGEHEKVQGGYGKSQGEYYSSRTELEIR
jgi:hypothetical protein